jgi:hypothetical protein
MGEMRTPSRSALLSAAKSKASKRFGVFSLLGSVISEGVSGLAEHIILANVADRIREGVGEMPFWKSMADHPHIIPIVLFGAWFIFVLYKAGKEADSEPNPPQITAKSTGPNSPAVAATAGRDMNNVRLVSGDEVHGDKVGGNVINNQFFGNHPNAGLFPFILLEFKDVDYTYDPLRPVVAYGDRTEFTCTCAGTDAFDVYIDRVQIGDIFLRSSVPVERIPHGESRRMPYTLTYFDKERNEECANLSFHGHLRKLFEDTAEKTGADLSIQIVVSYCGLEGPTVRHTVKRNLLYSAGDDRTPLMGAPEYSFVASATQSKPKPEITARWKFFESTSYLSRPGFRPLLQNTGSAVAVNITALPLEVDMPEADIAEHEALKTAIRQRMAGAAELPHTPKAWTVAYGRIDKLTPGGEELELTYKMQNAGMFKDDISDILRHAIDWSAHATFPFTVEFSDTGNPSRIWHTHYYVEYTFRAKKENQTLTSEFLGFFEVGAEGKCSRCIADEVGI